MSKCRACTGADQTAVVARRVTLNKYLWEWAQWGHSNCWGNGCPCDHNLDEVFVVP